MSKAEDVVINKLNENLSEIENLSKVDDLTNAKTLLNSSTSLFKTEEKNMSSEDVEKANKILTEMKKIVSEMDAKDDSKNSAAVALSQLMNDDTFNEIQEIEKQILYRRFYFPGGTPKLRVAGKGTNSPNDDFEYDQSTEGMDPFDHWDPRYLKDYIVVAKQNGFYKNFIYFDGYNTFKTINFSQARDALKNCVNLSTGKINNSGGCNKYEVAGIIAGLIYFDKVSSFIDFFGTNERLFKNIISVNADLIEPLIDELEDLTGQSKKEFKENNFGWMANNNAFSFDSAQYLSRWFELESKYNEYKDKVWKILENTNALQLCSNNVNVVGNNITIQQGLSCAQSISDGEKAKDEKDKSETKNEKGNVMNELKTTKADENGKVNTTITNDVDKVKSFLDKTLNDGKVNEDSNETETETENEPEPEPENENENSTSNKSFMIILVILIVIIISISFYLLFKSYSGGNKSPNIEISLNNQ